MRKLSKVSKQDQEAAAEYMARRDQEKTASRQKPYFPLDWTPPDAKPHLSKEDAKAVDKALADLMKPDKPRA